MRIVADRFVADNNTTISKVSVDGEFICFGLEDEYREKKVAGETRIPAGTYKVAPRKEGRHYAAYSKRWRWHRGALWIQNVPGFSYIMIHIGNTEKDTEGCLLVGSYAETTPGKMMIAQSAQAYELLYKKVIGEAEQGRLAITFIDNDR
jgi:hypothetical protein